MVGGFLCGHPCLIGGGTGYRLLFQDVHPFVEERLEVATIPMTSATACRKMLSIHRSQEIALERGRLPKSRVRGKGSSLRLLMLLSLNSMSICSNMPLHTLMESHRLGLMERPVQRRASNQRYREQEFLPWKKRPAANPVMISSSCSLSVSGTVSPPRA